MTESRFFVAMYGPSLDRSEEIMESEEYVYFSEVHRRVRQVLGDSLSLPEAAALAGLLSHESLTCADGFVFSDPRGANSNTIIGNREAVGIAEALTGDPGITDSEIWSYYLWHSKSRKLEALMREIKDKLLSGC